MMDTRNTPFSQKLCDETALLGVMYPESPFFGSRAIISLAFERPWVQLPYFLKVSSF